MPERIRFTKMHGAGNDYIYVDTSLYKIPDPALAAVEWSRPHFGIGSDGLILIGRSNRPDADFSMRIFNNDGSEAMMCGNGARCVAKYLYDKHLTSRNPIRLETLSGVKILHLNLSTDGTVHTVRVDMGEPRFFMPEQFASESSVLRADGRDFRGRFVSMGNPHFVVFVDDIDSLDIARYGATLERDEAFPQRANIEFAQVVAPGKIRTRVWERGSGITLACGTGASATVVAAAEEGLAPRTSTIVMDGGELTVDWQADNHVYLTGPAEISFEGEIPLPQ